MNKIKTILIFVFLIGLMMTVAKAAPAADNPAAVAEKPLIQVKQKVYSPGPRVYLSDASVITGGSKEQREALSRVYLCRVPTRAVRAYFPAEAHTENRKSRNIHRLHHAGCTGPVSGSLIYRLGFPQGPGDKARECLSQNKTPYSTVTPDDREIPSRMETPGGPVCYNCNLVPGEDGTHKVVVAVEVNGRPWRQFKFTAAPLQGKPRVTSLPKVKPSFKTPRRVNHRDASIKRTKRGIKKTSPLPGGVPAATRRSKIRVRRGDPVKVQIIRKNMMICVNGTAAQSGRVGDRIRVKTFGDGKFVNAVLIDQATARVEL